MTTLEALASRVDVYSIDEAFLDLTGIDRVVSFEPFGRQAIWLKVESPDGYDTTVNACACCRLTPPETYKPRCDAELTKGREATARLRELVANAQRIEVVDSGQADKYDRRLVHLLIDGRDVGQTLMAEGLAVEWRPGPNA
ncbi:Nucleotidyltransferase/DNA polymerase involved in DNA repair [Escherichia coli]|uniref:Nucleotidyltransferase/DNA polymerase involved in DNA repair n=2 Tax=Enterobacteriaceae TaxID=543 RepID=A0A377F591_ECOLX|nr:Nucleotidyltransferase/DNA polymerase involved in DNA repair [Escherichia coli]